VLSKSSTTDYCGHYVELPFKHAAATEFQYKGYARHHHDDDEGSLYSSHYSHSGFEEFDHSFTTLMNREL
jgi:hypothetical protein